MFSPLSSTLTCSSQFPHGCTGLQGRSKAGVQGHAERLGEIGAVPSRLEWDFSGWLGGQGPGGERQPGQQEPLGTAVKW